jgi:hypothetical protein
MLTAGSGDRMNMGILSAIVLMGLDYRSRWFVMFSALYIIIVGYICWHIKNMSIYMGILPNAEWQYPFGLYALAFTAIFYMFIISQFTKKEKVVK